MALALPITLNNVNKDAADDFISGKTFKVMLFTSALVSDDENISDKTEITPGNGYSAGGVSVTVTSVQDGASAYLVATQPILSASGGDIGPYAGFAIYEVATGKLCGAWNKVTPIAIANGSDKTFQFNQDAGFLHWGDVEP